MSVNCYLAVSSWLSHKSFLLLGLGSFGSLENENYIKLRDANFFSRLAQSRY